MLDPNTPSGTKILCIDTQSCFSSCNCGGGHPLGPLKEGRIYTFKAVSPADEGEDRPRAGYNIHVEEIDRSDEESDDLGYAPDRFVPLKPKWQATRRTERAPIRSKKLEEA